MSTASVAVYRNVFALIVDIDDYEGETYLQTKYASYEKIRAYDFYLEQKYLHEGRVEARILTAAQAEDMGYEDGYIRSHADHKLYVDGFDNTDAIHNYLSDLECQPSRKKNRPSPCPSPTRTSGGCLPIFKREASPPR